MVGQGAGQVAGRSAHSAAAAAASGAMEALSDPRLLLINAAKRANGRYRRGDYVGAAEAYLQAIQMGGGAPATCHPVDLATLHFNCARAALKQGRHVLALAQAQAALGLNGTYVNARMLQAWKCVTSLPRTPPSC